MDSRWRRRHTSWVALAVLLAVTMLLPPGSARAEPEHFDLKFSGVIEDLGANTWTVAGVTLSVTERTVIRPTTGQTEPGMWADVMAEVRAEEIMVAIQIVVRPPEMRLMGPVSQRPAGDVGMWTIAGQELRATPETRISERVGSLDPPNWAEVFAVEDPTLGLVAQRIRGIQTQESVKVFGAIQEATADAWTLSKVDLRVDENTLISGDPQVGLLAHAEALLQDDQSLLALHLNPVWIEPNAERPDVSFRGEISALPASGSLVGLWTVAERTVRVSAATVINDIKGPVEVGAVVHVVGWEEDGVVLAWRVTVLAGQEPGWQPLRFRGIIRDMPPHGLLGRWAIDGHQVMVTQRTRIQGAQHAQIGVPAEVGAVRRQNGQMEALWLRIGRPPMEGEDLEAEVPLG